MTAPHTHRCPYCLREYDPTLRAPSAPPPGSDMPPSPATEPTVTTGHRRAPAGSWLRTAVATVLLLAAAGGVIAHHQDAGSLFAAAVLLATAGCLWRRRAMRRLRSRGRR